MKAITCPQCGSLISKVSEKQAIIQCDYCGAKVMLPRENTPPQNAEDKPKLINEVGYPIDQNILYEEKPSSKNSLSQIVLTVVVVLTIGVVSFLMFIGNSKHAPVKTGLNPTPVAAPTFSPKTKKDNNVLLEFGGKGTSAGWFDYPNEITVDKAGNIYVSDETLRVQRFDAYGKFLNLWNVKGDSKKETIDKLAADADGNVYVLIGGEIVVYNGQTGEQKYVLSDSRKHYIDDFVLRDDGGMMYVAENTRNEEFVQAKDRAVVNRFVGIHTKAADADLTTKGIKLAVDGKGEIYSVFALGSLLYGEHSYNEEDLMTFHFSPQGKFVNKFAIGLMPSAILIDNQSRIYILDTKADSQILVFSGAGSEIKRISAEGFLTKAIAIDKQNNLYVISGETIRKLKAIDFGS